MISANKIRRGVFTSTVILLNCLFIITLANLNKMAYNVVTYSPQPYKEDIYTFEEPYEVKAPLMELIQPFPPKQTAFVVPNIVHYVWIGQNEPFLFHHMLGVRSTYQRMKPQRIVFHCDNEPVGKWWKFARETIPILRVVNLEPPSEIFGNEIILPIHKADITRLDILAKYGGIYLDLDVIVLKSFDLLRRYNFTMGLEYHGSPGCLNNGIIISQKGAKFLDVWYQTYNNFSKHEQDEHSCQIPYNMQFLHPDLVHVEESTLNYPSGKRLDLIYDKSYDWSRNYAIHLWQRLHEFEHNPYDIKEMNTTFGEITRLIYYGSPKIIINHAGSLK